MLKILTFFFKQFLNDLTIGVHDFRDQCSWALMNWKLSSHKNFQGFWSHNTATKMSGSTTKKDKVEGVLGGREKRRLIRKDIGEKEWG